MLRVNGRRYSVNGSNYFIKLIQLVAYKSIKYEVDMLFLAIYPVWIEIIIVPAI